MSRKAVANAINEGSVVADVFGYLMSAMPELRPRPDSSSNPRSAAEVTTNEVERVTWVEFASSPISSDEVRSASPRMLKLLLLGYTDGFQAWDISDMQDIREVLSLRDVCATSVTLLPPPEIRDGDAKVDRFATTRPLLAVCDGDSSSKRPVRLMSLRTGEFLAYDIVPSGSPPIIRTEANSTAVCLISHSLIRVLSSATMETLLEVKDCLGYIEPNRGWGVTAATLGSNWLAYSTTELLTARSNSFVQSMDGSGRSDTDDSTVAAVVGMAQKTGTELWYMGGAGIKKMSDMMNGTEEDLPRPSQHAMEPILEHKAAYGMVRIIDICGDLSSCVMTSDMNTDISCRTIAHFRAHVTGRPLAILQFDRAGTLLATADVDGQVINIFSITRCRKSSGFMVPQCIFRLNRGVTTVLLREISFSADSRWISVVSDHGTVHLFAIHPMGCDVRARTHTSLTVPSNDPYATSAGITDMEQNWPKVVHGAHVKLKHGSGTVGGMQHSSNGTVLDSDITLKNDTYIQMVAKRLPGCVSAKIHEYQSIEEDGGNFFSIFSATMSGALVEHRIFPHANDGVSKANAEAAANYVGGIRITDTGAAVHSAIQSTLKTVGNVVTGVRDMMTGSPTEATVLAQSSEDSLEVICIAYHWWNVCRMKDWKSTARVFDQQLSDRTNSTTQGTQHIASGITTTNHDQSWLGQVELSTCAYPHRRLWMGPQFSFRGFDEEKSVVNQLADGESHMVYNAMFPADTVVSGDGIGGTVQQDIAEAIGS